MLFEMRDVQCWNVRPDPETLVPNAGLLSRG